MIQIRPIIAAGIGPRSIRTIQQYAGLVKAHYGAVQAILPVVLDFAAGETSLRSNGQRLHYLKLGSPTFDDEDEWPGWLPPELCTLSQGQRERTRAWVRAAWFQQVEEFQDFLLENVPRLCSFAAVEELSAQGLGLEENSEIDIYIVADLNDLVGSSVAVDMAYLLSHACLQLGFTPRTAGVFYLPSALSPAPAEEAVAYAALKELDHYLAGHPYNDDLLPETMRGREVVLFDSGCYLLDSVNEVGYMVQEETELIRTTSEWLYAMTFLGIGTAVRQQHRQGYRGGTLRGKPRAFQSLGLSIRYVPYEPLLEWGTAQLGLQIVQCFLDSRVDADPAEQSQAFMAQLGLDADVLESRMRYANGAARTDEALSQLYRQPLGEIEAKARQVLQAFRSRDLPALEKELKEQSQRVVDEAKTAIMDELRSALSGTPRGRISLARQTLACLRDRIAAQQSAVQEQTKRYTVDLSRSLATVSQTSYMLRQALMSVPPWHASALIAVALLVLPFVYSVQLVMRVVRPVSEQWATIALGVLFLGVSSTVALVLYRYARGKKLVAAQHVRQIQERFELESKPLFHRAMSKVYETTLAAIDETQAALDALTGHLETLETHLKERLDERSRYLEALSAPGPCRSAIDLQQARRLLQRAGADLDLPVALLALHAGPVSSWLERCREPGQNLVPWLAEQITRVGVQYLGQHLSEEQADEALVDDTSLPETHRALQHLLERALPLWNYDPRVVRRAKTQHLVLVATNGGPVWSKLSGPLAEICPDAVHVPIQESHTLIVLNVHRGLPLFALRRIQEYRLHYGEMLLHSKLPLYSTAGLALADDLLPMQRPVQLGPATLFAAGLALGIVGRGADGRYVAPRDAHNSIRLSPQKERSVALMGMDENTCHEVQRQLEALVSRWGDQEVQKTLDAYLDGAPQLQDWEVQGILEFGRRYGLESDEYERS